MRAKLSDYSKRVLIAAGTLLGLVAIIYFIWELARVFLLVFAGALLAVILSGLTNLFADRTDMPRLASLATIILIVIALHVAFGMLAGPRLVNQAGQLSERIPQAIDQLEQVVATQPWGNQVLRRTPEPEKMVTPQSGNVSSGTVLGALSDVAGVMTNILVVLIIAIYLAVRPQLYIQSIASLVPKSKRKRVGELMGAIGHALRWWVVGRAASMVVVGVLTGLGLLFVGIPLFFSLGVIAALFSIVPYIGPIAGAIPAMLIALTISPMKMIYVALIFIAVQLLESNLITPLIQHQAVSVPPALLISVQLVGGVLAGVLGVLIATPLAVTVTVAVQMLYVEDVLGDHIRVLGEAEEIALQNDAGEDVV